MGSKSVAYYCRVAIDNDEEARAERAKKETVRHAILRILADVTSGGVQREDANFCAVPYRQYFALHRFELATYNKLLVNLLKKKYCLFVAWYAHSNQIKQRNIRAGFVPVRMFLYIFFIPNLTAAYLKDQNDRHKLVVDPVAADIVRQIFGMFAEGIGYVRMTKILREKKILNPQAYFNQNNPNYHKSDYWRQPFDWHATSVRSILNNPVYLGKVVFGRRKTKGFFDKSIVDVPEQDWIVVDDAHEPLITQEVWDTVHQLMKARHRENTSGEVQMFAGLVKCAGCGSSLNVSYSKQKRQYKNFSCWVYKNYGKERCTSHTIGWVTMQQLVLEDIRRNAKAAKLAKQQYMDMLVAAKCKQQRRETEKSRKELKSVRKRMTELEKILNKLYEDLALERITESRYQAMAPRYESEQDELRAKETGLSQAVEQAEDTYSRIEEFVPIISKYTDITKLNTYILNELIERIIVHEKTVDEDGRKSQRVDIYYKFVGYIS